MEELQLVYAQVKESMNGSLEHLDHELGAIRAGKANPKMLDSVQVNYYGALTPLTQVANVSVPDAKTIMVQPWEKTLINDIEKAILDANIGITPDNNGEIIRINIPALSQERRRDLVKQANKEGENAKISIRNARKEGNDMLKDMKGDIGEDDIKIGEKEIQSITDDFIAQIDTKLKKKEEDIMTV